MSLTLLTVVVDCTDPGRLASFWAQALGYEARERNPGDFLVSDPAGVAFPMYFMEVPDPTVGKNRWHVDLLAPGDMAAEVDRLVALGARVIEVRSDPDTHENPDTWTVLEDPEGNVFCVVSEQTRTGWA